MDYVENIRKRRVLPSVEPGYLQPLIPNRPPYLREPWSKIMPDIERYIMPGVSSALVWLGTLVTWPMASNFYLEDVVGGVGAARRAPIG